MHRNTNLGHVNLAELSYIHLVIATALQKSQKAPKSQELPQDVEKFMSQLTHLQLPQELLTC